MIKKTNLCAIAAAISALAAGAASAQTVTLFGRIDAGVEYQSKTPRNEDNTGDRGSLTSVRNGGILPSIWGLKGTEDLGGGLKAVFNLESDFDSGTGGRRGLGAIDGAFGRQANVGLSSDLGTVLIGRQYSPALLAELGVDPRGYKESYSSLLTYALNQAPADNDVGPNNSLGIFTSNLISYSGTFGPISVGAGYGLGEGLGGLGDGRTYALGVSYVGPVTIAGSYQQIEGSPDSETKRYGVGFAVPLGMATIKGIYAHATTDNNAGVEVVKSDNYGVGVDLKWAASQLATIAFYYGDNDKRDDDTTKTLIVSNDYSLSKRTTLYAQYVYVDADDGATGVTQISAGATPSGEKTHILGVGIKHDF